MLQLESQTKDSYSGARFQPKLKIGQPGDKYEQEADAVADRVMKMSATETMQMQPEEEKESLQMKPMNENLVQMKCKECEEEEMLQAKSDSGGGYASPEISKQIQWSKGSGTTLSTDTNRFMSNSFGTDFSQVNIHTGSYAVLMNQQLGARAFTHGNDIYFNSGEYQTGSENGKRLLAHELTHVTQQTENRNLIHRSPSDFNITEISPEDAANPSMIFFISGSTSIPASETHKISTLATPPAQNLTLNGFSSEEGSDATNDRIVNDRINSVDSALASAGHTGTRAPVNLRASGEGQLDYRHMRSVEVIPTPVGLLSAPSGVSACAAAGSEVEPCGSAFTNAWPDADNAMKKAVKDLTPPVSAQATTLLSTLFSGVPQATVLTNITNLAAQVHVLPTHHSCHNTCDGGCDGPAYNEGAGIGAPPAESMITLCPDFLNSSSLDWQSQILIHESAHGTSGLNAEDIAYSNTRQISFLSAADQVRNTDSYVLLAWLLFRPGSINIGPSTADTLSGMTVTEENNAKEAIAWLESWLNYGSFDTAILYDTVNRSVPPAVAWDTTQRGDIFNRETMNLISPIFGLTNPGIAAPFTLPNDNDKTKIAAIHDRYEQMYSSVNWQVLTVNKGGAGSDAWGSHGATLPRLDQTVTIGPSFFGMTPVDRIKHLVFLMASAMHGISSGFRQKYADAMDVIRIHRNLGP